VCFPNESLPRKILTPYFPPSTQGCLLFSVILLLQATSKRIRRGNPSNSVLNTCALHIAADHLFFKHVGSGSESVTVAEMVYHVAMADKGFRATDFSQDGGPGDDIGFVIAAVTVFKDPESEGSQSFVAQKILSQFLYRPVSDSSAHYKLET